MFKNLERVLEEKHINRTTLASILGVDIKTITNRFAGIHDWTLPEVLKIEELCPEYRIDWLFKKTKTE